ALAKSDADNQIIPEIMVPLIGDVKELEYLKNHISKVADSLIAESGKELEYHIGTMIEIPRAALTSAKIAGVADFFSYGTNDLTQMSYGLSRDDAGKILDVYIEKGIYESDPTAHLDIEGVGRLMKISSEEGRSVKPDLKLGICGEHGGDPSAVEYCHELGFNYVSCSPYRVPIAKLAAAQAQIKNPR
ncbi:MAG: pyruvate, phosphate dikinase, partial [Clostridiaceae bacterium]|nr:pyruvate, phosphate dikinase [Clostridiaceae bacterium]